MSINTCKCGRPKRLHIGPELWCSRFRKSTFTSISPPPPPSPPPPRVVREGWFDPEPIAAHEDHALQSVTRCLNCGTDLSAGGACFDSSLPHRPALGALGEASVWARCQHCIDAAHVAQSHEPKVVGAVYPEHSMLIGIGLSSGERVMLRRALQMYLKFYDAVRADKERPQWERDEAAAVIKAAEALSERLRRSTSTKAGG